MPSVRQIQTKILVIAKYVDALCRKKGIEYCIAFGSALGAVRHGGFIPWDDDLDILMTPAQYTKFRDAFLDDNPSSFVLQEWFVADDIMEYAKVRMNNTTFIEEATQNRADIHQGIFIDIFILHKVPECRLVQRWIWFLSKFTALYALSKRNWKPKTATQALLLKSLAILPCRWLANTAYHWMGRYDALPEKFYYCFWIGTSSFFHGLLPPSSCFPVSPVPFEDTTLLAPVGVRDMLESLFGDYMTLPPLEARAKAVHAMFADTEHDYTRYIPDAVPVTGCLQTVPLLQHSAEKRL